jgi:hypothetical protein
VKEPSDFEKFAKVMSGLMVVPYQELQKNWRRIARKKSARSGLLLNTKY